MALLTGFVLLSYLVTVTVCITCPTGWNMHHGSSCYTILSTPRTFDESERACETDGGHLAIINNVDEQNYLTAYTKAHHEYNGKHIWIDGTDRETPGHWFWEWTGEGLDRKYTNWHTRGGEPNNLGGHEHCMEYGSPYEYQWNDIPCDNHFYALCEKD